MSGRGLFASGSCPVEQEQELTSSSFPTIRRRVSSLKPSDVCYPDVTRRSSATHFLLSCLRSACLASRDPYCIWLRTGSCANMAPGFK